MLNGMHMILNIYLLYHISKIIIILVCLLLMEWKEEENIARKFMMSGCYPSAATKTFFWQSFLYFLYKRKERL